MKAVLGHSWLSLLFAFLAGWTGARFVLDAGGPAAALMTVGLGALSIFWSALEHRFLDAGGA